MHRCAELRGLHQHLCITISDAQSAVRLEMSAPPSHSPRCSRLWTMTIGRRLIPARAVANESRTTTSASREAHSSPMRTKVPGGWPSLTRGWALSMLVFCAWLKFRSLLPSPTNALTPFQFLLEKQEQQRHNSISSARMQEAWPKRWLGR